MLRPIASRRYYRYLVREKLQKSAWFCATVSFIWSVISSIHPVSDKTFTRRVKKNLIFVEYCRLNTAPFSKEDKPQTTQINAKRRPIATNVSRTYAHTNISLQLFLSPKKNLREVPSLTGQMTDRLLTW